MKARRVTAHVRSPAQHPSDLELLLGQQRNPMTPGRTQQIPAPRGDGFSDTGLIVESGGIPQ